MQILERTLLETYYDFMMTLLIYMDSEIRILSCQELLEKKMLFFIQPAESYFWRPVSGSSFGLVKVRVFHCEQDRHNAVGNAP